MKAHKIHDVFGRVTEDEQRARRSAKSGMRGEYITASFGEDAIRAPSDDFAAKVTDDTPLSDIYAMLTDEQKKKLRHSVEHPPLRVKWVENGEVFEAWVAEEADLLLRLENGVYVGPVSETQVKRKPGDKAF